MLPKQRPMKPQASDLARTVTGFVCKSQCAENIAGRTGTAAALTMLRGCGVNARVSAHSMEN